MLKTAARTLGVVYFGSSWSSCEVRVACQNGVSRRAFVLGGMFGVKGFASSHRWSLCRIRSMGWGRLMLEIRWYTSFWMLDFG